jgi:hypothetical protein
LNPLLLGHACGVGGDRADDLQWRFLFDSSAKQQRRAIDGSYFHLDRMLQ